VRVKIMVTPVSDEYLHDGVYASFDGYHIWLDLRGQGSPDRIALEPRVFRELLRYAAKCGFEIEQPGE
jgi:hypothetical protein